MRGKPLPTILPIIPGRGLSSLTAQKGPNPVTIGIPHPPIPDRCPECQAPESAIWVNRNTGQLLCTNCGGDVSPTPTYLAFIDPEEA